MKRVFFLVCLFLLFFSRSTKLLRLISASYVMKSVFNWTLPVFSDPYNEFDAGLSYQNFVLTKPQQSIETFLKMVNCASIAKYLPSLNFYSCSRISLLYSLIPR